MAESSIEWTDETWNPVTGCDRVSPGCAHCYALTSAPRQRRLALGREARKPGSGGAWAHARDGGPASGPAFGVTLHPSRLTAPLRWGKPRMVFVNSMSDLFHEDISAGYIAAVFAVMAGAPKHTFQVLTKRPERMRELLSDPAFWLTVRVQAARGIGDVGSVHRFGVPHALVDQPLPNVWLGVTIENRRFVQRADVLRDTPAAVRFISAEPLLGPLVPKWYSQPPGWPSDELAALAAPNAPLPIFGPGNGTPEWDDGYAGPGLDLSDIDWLIVGGESGKGFRPFQEAWAHDLLVEARDHDTAYFLKQTGGYRPGGALEDLPAGLRIRELPERTVAAA